MSADSKVCDFHNDFKDDFPNCKLRQNIYCLASFLSFIDYQFATLIPSLSNQALLSPDCLTWINAENDFEKPTHTTK